MTVPLDVGGETLLASWRRCRAAGSPASAMVFDGRPGKAKSQRRYVAGSGAGHGRWRRPRPERNSGAFCARRANSAGSVQGRPWRATAARRSCFDRGTRSGPSRGGVSDRRGTTAPIHAAVRARPWHAGEGRYDGDEVR